MERLKPCPFCGGEAEMLTAESMNGGYLFGIMCNDCCSRGDVYDTEAEAVEAWNTRHERTCESVFDGNMDGTSVCSECGCEFPQDPSRRWALNYCPNCGARVVKL